MKRFLHIAIIALMAYSCAGMEDPEVVNRDNALDGWWYLASLYDQENMSSGEPLIFRFDYTAEDTREWRHIEGTSFTAYELIFMIGYDIDPETGDYVEINKKYVAEHQREQMFTSLFMSPGPYGNCIPYSTNDEGDRLDSYANMETGDDTISLFCTGGPYSYDWIDRETPADLNYDGIIDYNDMYWQGRIPRIEPYKDGVQPTTFKVTNLWRRSDEATFRNWKNTLENL